MGNLLNWIKSFLKRKKEIPVIQNCQIIDISNNACSSSFYILENESWGKNIYGTKYWNVRDNKGRFMKKKWRLPTQQEIDEYFKIQHESYI